VTPLSAFAELRTPYEIHDTKIEDPAAAFERLERAAVVRESLRKLPSTWQEVLSLRNAHPGDWRPIADALGTTTGAARALWYRALEGLRERLLQNDCFRNGSI
jgi:DNA-directed RNA polymerase specialized sigma24 family protein